MLLEDIEEDMLEADEDMAEELTEDDALLVTDEADEFTERHMPRVPISRRLIAR